MTHVSTARRIPATHTQPRTRGKAPPRPTPRRRVSRRLMTPGGTRDPRRGWDYVSTGRGDVPWEQCFRMLNTIGHEGPISIEWEDADMDRTIGAAEALKFVH